MTNLAMRWIRRWSWLGLLACLLLGLVSHLATAGCGTGSTFTTAEQPEVSTIPAAMKPSQTITRQGTAGSESGDVHRVPTMRWQPPAWTAHLALQADKIVKSSQPTMATALHELGDRLDGQDLEFTLYRIADDGFALATRATSVPDASTSRSRSFIIAVTGRSLDESTDRQSRPLQAREGHLPDVIADIPIDQNTKIYIFLREYDDSDDGRSWTLRNASHQSVAAHLAEANLWSEAELASALLTTSRG